MNRQDGPLLVGANNENTNTAKPLLVNDDGELLVSTAGAGGVSDVNLDEVGGVAITLGQKAMAASLPVVLASDQSPVPVTGTVTAVTSITNPVTVIGSVADDSPTPGNPVTVAGLAKSPDGTDPSSLAENDVARFITDLNRRVYVNANHPRSLVVHLDGTSAYTDQALIADPGDGFQAVITNIIGSTGAATALNFFLEEGSTKIFGPIYLEAVAGRGFCSGPLYLPVTPSTSVTLTSSAAIAQSYNVTYFVQAV